jgi:hypothetical protein
MLRQFLLLKGTCSLVQNLTVSLAEIIWKSCSMTGDTKEFFFCKKSRLISDVFSSTGKIMYLVP